MKECVSALNMAATLRAWLRLRFSETAVLRVLPRPRPRHHDAGRHVPGSTGAGPPRLAIGRRRHADHAREGAAERPQAGEADVQADLRHRLLGLAQQRHRALEPAPLEVAVWCLAERLLERPDEV